MGGSAVANTYSFTADGANGGTITGKLLLLQDGLTSLGTVSFGFSLPSTTIFSNSASILIPDYGSAVPYPSSISVSGTTGVVSKARAIL